MSRPAARHRTTWKYTDRGAGGTYIRIGFVQNSEVVHDGYKYDCIRIQVKSGWGDKMELDFCVRIDEAASMASGFSLVCADMMSGKYGRKQVENHASGLKRGKL